jgi:D-alanine--poly(phosphoribitol) ligase subunit 1
MGMLDLWPSLAIGKPVILLDHRNNPLPRANLRLLTRSESIVPGSWFSTPTFLEIMCSEAAFNESALPRLRTFFVAGEAVQRSLIAKLIDRFPGAEIWHGYGPTEVTCLTHCLRLSSPDLIGSGPLPLGRVLSPTAIRIIGDTGREVAVGEYGEIELAGPQVAHGYLPKDLPGMSAFGSRDDVRFYRTGDYGVLDQEGSLKLSGRRDDQVKWKGNRIEIAEIEQDASDAQMARKTAVVPIRREGQVIDLILVVQLNHDNPDGRSAFRNHLARSLPPYMRPRSIRFVSSMPVTLHGKLDRTRLATELIDAPKGEP